MMVNVGQQIVNKSKKSLNKDKNIELDEQTKNVGRPIEAPLLQ